MSPLLRRWVVWGAIGLVVVAALAIGATRSTAHPTLYQRTASLASQVRCPVCGGESAEQSQVPAAVNIRNQIHQELPAGVAPARVLDDLVNAYGPAILERPPASGIGLVVWVLPVAAFVVAAVGLILAFARWRRPRAVAATTGDSPAAPRPDDEALVARAMARSPLSASPAAAPPLSVPPAAVPAGEAGP